MYLIVMTTLLLRNKTQVPSSIHNKMSPNFFLSSLIVRVNSEINLLVTQIQNSINLTVVANRALQFWIS